MPRKWVYPPPSLTTRRLRGGGFQVRVYYPPHQADRYHGSWRYARPTIEEAVAAALADLAPVLVGRAHARDHLFPHHQPQPTK